MARKINRSTVVLVAVFLLLLGGVAWATARANASVGQCGASLAASPSMASTKYLSNVTATGQGMCYNEASSADSTIPVLGGRIKSMSVYAELQVQVIGGRYQIMDHDAELSSRAGTLNVSLSALCNRTFEGHRWRVVVEVSGKRVDGEEVNAKYTSRGRFLQCA